MPLKPPKYDMQQIAAYRSLPLTYQCFALEITNRCPAKCAICYQNTERPGATTGLDLCETSAIQSISEAAQSPLIHKRFHVAGGEAFLDLPKCLRLFSHAKSAGFFEITATTNAYWAKDFDKAIHVADALKKAGVTALEVSTDYWHQQYVKPSSIDNCVRALKNAGVGVMLRILFDRISHHR